MPANKPTAEQELRISANVFKKGIEPLEAMLVSAIRCGYPEEFIHMLEYMIETTKTVAEFRTRDLPIVPRKSGRPRKDDPTVKDKCREIFEAFTPRYIPSKTRIKKQVDVQGKVKPQEGFTFNFTK
ncbi:hypothetical protein [Pseudomonas sp. GV047]|uniref:hypothetical protein n=1 Tax=Pseudomonas sp. GV047 TaxID=2135751 RepID=UPI000D35D24B|nr:hypothetical protein [Pseudomonas sp. GV047]PUB40059.1 hypothetical protein C8K58_11445 [Pseudomonas sp. GV047]